NRACRWAWTSKLSAASWNVWRPGRSWRTDDGEGTRPPSDAYGSLRQRSRELFKVATHGFELVLGALLGALSLAGKQEWGAGQGRNKPKLAGQHAAPKPR